MAFTPKKQAFNAAINAVTLGTGDKSIVITEDESKNIIRLYYDLKVAPVTVKHYYKTTTITPAG